ncbi:MAG: IPT/TIG domain-containing protein [Bifidobacteriaceae bacterium]|jgi:hypothetical protein|nr:IPT/TIG domain-containing protein [Bifidobacteriaceae bacterium]
MLNFINNKFKNNKFRKIKDLNLKKIGLTLFIWVFCATLFLGGSNFAQGSASGTALPISFGGTGANTQAGALINLGINNTLDKNSVNSTFPSAKTVYDYMNKTINPGNISMDNINFSDSITSWTGGDLIYKGSGLSSTASNNKIKVGDKACTTSGQGYTSNSAAGDGIPQVGCILPDLAAGTHAVTISTDGGTSYTINAGNVIYIQTPALSNCDTTSMQTFGANAAACKAVMAQGQVIVLNDTRNNQKYRVKKMPDGNISMVDNGKYSSIDPLFYTYCFLSSPPSKAITWRNNSPGSFTGCGTLNEWISLKSTTFPNGWSLFTEGLISQLKNKMSTAAANSNGNRNPVYSISNNLCGSSSSNSVAPWLGVYSGYYRYDSDSFFDQGNSGSYWTSSLHPITGNPFMFTCSNTIDSGYKEGVYEAIRLVL